GVSQARVNALMILRLSGNLRLAYLAADALADRSAAVREQAAKTLRAMTDQYFVRERDVVGALFTDWDTTHDYQSRRQGVLTVLQEERRCLADALRIGLERFASHHRPDVLEAAMFLVDDLAPVLFGAAGGRRQPFRHAMLEVFARSQDPRLAPFFYAALDQSELRTGALDILAARQNQDFFEALFRERHRLRRAGTKKALSTLHRLSWIEPGVVAVMALPDDVQAAALEFLAALGLHEDHLFDLFRGLLDYDAPEALTEAAWLISGRRGQNATDLLNGLTHADCPEARRIARFELSRRHHQRRGRAAGAHPSSSSGWLQLVHRHRLSATFESIWEAADRLTADSYTAVGDLLIEKIPAFLAQLRQKLLAASPTDRIRAHRVMSIFQLESHFHTEVFGQADDSDELVRRLALETVGRIGNATSRRILERALDDSSPRVRRVAVEALGAAGGERSRELLSACLRDNAPAVRTEAIRALLQHREPRGVAALIESLRDPRRAHRLAALALVGRMNLSALKKQVAILAERDGNEQIRRRAQRILHLWKARIDESEVPAGRPVAKGAV
ncbi:MAG: HEAT repeat domain-containing protein, partial [Phycisphaerae bacterium]